MKYRCNQRLQHGASLGRSISVRTPIVPRLEGFAELAVAKHDLKRAATILGAAARLREEIGLALSVHEEREHKRVAAATRAVLGDDAFDQAWREGGAMELEEAVRYAMNGRATRHT